MVTVTDYDSPCKETNCNELQQDHHEENHLGSAVLALVAEKMGEKRFDLWFGQETRCEFVCCGSKEKTITFFVRNNFAIQSIRRHCHQEIDQAVLDVFGEKISVDFVVPPQKNTPQKEDLKKTIVSPSIPRPIQQSDHSPLGQLFKKSESLDKGIQNKEWHGKEKTGRYFASMATFLVGNSNRNAYKAADLAATCPGMINPIYLFGPTSVGKTHILEGIYSAARTSSARRMPRYMTAEQFLSDFIGTIRSGSIQERNQGFRSQFKGVSHLLLDDIHFLARASSTQTELLQIFDLLRNQGVQLVLTGNCPLKDLPLRSELICRLESGTVCGIELPERELSLRICENLVKQRELPMDAEVCRLIASRFGVHARQISGALNRLHLLYLSNNKPITLEAAEEALSDLLRLNRRDIRLQDIGKAVSETFGISEETLRSKSRIKQIAAPRMLAMWLARKYTRAALSEIGLYFGNLSHSSVISAQRKIDKQIMEDQVMAEKVQRIEQLLG